MCYICCNVFGMGGMVVVVGLFGLFVCSGFVFVVFVVLVCQFEVMCIDV